MLVLVAGTESLTSMWREAAQTQWEAGLKAQQHKLVFCCASEEGTHKRKNVGGDGNVAAHSTLPLMSSREQRGAKRSGRFKQC